MFRNRDDAGRKLALRLKERALRDPIVMAIPRGGIVVGAAIARELGAELDVVLARKLRAPGQPELAIGAVSEDGSVYFNSHLSELPETLEDYLASERHHQLEEIARRQRLFRRIRPAARITGRSVIVTDDGIATGSTMIAALHALRGQHPDELIVAVPVAAPERLAQMRHLCDDAVCLLTPDDFWAIGQFFEDFTQVEDEQVIKLLREFAPASALSADFGPVALGCDPSAHEPPFRSV